MLWKEMRAAFFLPLLASSIIHSECFLKLSSSHKKPPKRKASNWWRLCPFWRALANFRLTLREFSMVPSSWVMTRTRGWILLMNGWLAFYPRLRLCTEFMHIKWFYIYWLTLNWKSNSSSSFTCRKVCKNFFSRSTLAKSGCRRPEFMHIFTTTTAIITLLIIGLLLAML